MKTIGLLGGMSWESTAIYYKLINEATKSRLGGLHSAPIAMFSVDFDEIETLQRSGNWVQAANLLADKAKSIEKAGADFLLICTNTMHKVADEVKASINIPLIHIADATASVLKENQIKKVGLLGTRFTMEQAFYRERLASHDMHVITPDEVDRNIVHRIIYEELCLGVLNDPSRQEMLRIIEKLRGEGAQGIIQGCTEIAMLVTEEHTDTPLFDTARIHAEEAVNFALK